MMYTKVNKGTKMAEGIIATFKSNNRWSNRGNIWEAYSKPSDRKVKAWEAIVARAEETEGYNHDIRVTGVSSHFFSTMYSFTDAEGTHIVYDTPSNVRIVTL